MATNIIHYLLANTDLKQKDIAEKVGVSTTQVSKWKKGDYISSIKEQELEELAGIIEYSIEWTETVKTKENSDKWIKYVLDCGKEVDHPIALDSEIALRLLLSVSRSGVTLPQTPPEKRPEDECFDDEIDGESLIDYEDRSKNHKYSDYYLLIDSLLENYYRINTWYEEFILWNDYDEDDISYPKEDMDFLVYSLSMKHLEQDYLQNLDYSKQTYIRYMDEIDKEFRRCLHKYCKGLITHNKPMLVDYFNIINNTPYELEDEAMIYSYLPNTDKYLSYGDKKILRELEDLNIGMNILFEKLGLKKD